MKSYRRILALLLCLLMVCTASCASAATKKPSKTFTAVPTIRFTKLPTNGIRSGTMKNVTISASVPGFLNFYLTDMDGNIILTFAENMEIPSNTTTFDFYAADENDEPLAPGNYMFSANMVSQFGVASKVHTAKTSVRENPDLEEEEEYGDETEDDLTATIVADANEIEAITASGIITDASSASAPSVTAAPKATPIPEKLTYVAGESKMGDEGLLIGVGVSDVAAQTDAGYWGLTASATDAELWAAITRKMTGVDVGENESAYIYDSPENGRKTLGTVSGISQGLNVITNRGDGWSLVEAFRNEDGAFVRGYIKSNKLRPVDPNPHYGIVIDKATQTLIVLKDGVRVGSCKVTTGLPTTKYPHRETPAGEFITVTRRGTYEYYGTGNFTKDTIRINGNYYLAEIPTTKKNGTKFVDTFVAALGTKSTRGTICIAHEASADGGINADWIWDMTDENKRVKVLIFDDKPRTDVPVSAK